jgi:ribonuclease R
LKFRLGDAVRVQVLRASLEDRKIDFRLAPQAKSKDEPRRHERHEEEPRGKAK